MTQDEKWQQQFDEVMDFMNTYHRRPSKHRIEEHLMLNWIKYNKKLIAKGTFPDDRLARFKQLLETADKYRRLNQYG